MKRSKQEGIASQTDESGNTAESEKECAARSCSKHVRELAYFKWQQAGCPDCDGVEFWLAAEAEIQEPQLKSTGINNCGVP